MQPRAVILHLDEPVWSHKREEKTWRSTVVEPLLAGVLSCEQPVSLVLGGRSVEMLARKMPEAFGLLSQAIASGRIGLLATPIHPVAMSALPARDAIGQLRTHVTALKRTLGHRPEGCLLPQTAWDPVYPRILRKAGLNWTVLDGRWLDAVGAPGSPVLAVEREGYMVAVLRGGSAPTEGLALLRVRTADDVPAAQALMSCPLVPVESLLESPRARAYLPAGGPEGLWEARLLEDAGADALHKTMLQVSREVRRLHRAVERSAHDDEGLDPHRLEQARRYLYRAQTGTAYGGTDCSTAVRAGAWRDLLRAEALAMSELEVPVPQITVDDLDCDGRSEVRLVTDGWGVQLGSDGDITEMSRRDAAFNILSGPRPVGFRVWLGNRAPTGWELVTTASPGNGFARAVSHVESTVEGVPVQVTRGVQIGPSGPMDLRFELQNRGMEATRTRLVLETWLALGGRRWRDDAVVPVAVELGGGREPLDEVIELPPVEAIGITGWRARVDLEFSPEASVTIEPHEDGIARLSVSWPVELFVRDRARREVTLHVREIPDG